MSRSLLRLGAGAVIILVLATTAVVWLMRRPAPAHDTLFLSGRIEGDESILASKTAGRVRTITPREGDRVAKGSVVAQLDDAQVFAREDQSRAALAQAQATRDRAREAIDVLGAQLAASDAQVGQSRVDAEGRVAQAQGQLAAAQAAVLQADASYAQYARDADRFRTLSDTGDVSLREAEQAETAARTQRAVLAADRRQVDAARGATRAAEANERNPGIHTSQADAVRAQIVQADSDVKASDAEVVRALAQLREVRADRGDLEIRTPFEGTVTTRAAEPGEIVAAGTPIITLVDLRRVYLRGFIPEGDIGRVRIGQHARVFIDSAPSTAIDAIVSRIDPEASFTPENTYFEKDRVKQVVGVKLTLRGAIGFAKPGMPADALILISGTSWQHGAEK